MTWLYIVLGIILLALGIIFFSNLKFEVKAFADEKGYDFHLVLRHLTLVYKMDKGGDPLVRTMSISIFGLKLPFSFQKSFEKKKKMAEEEELSDEEDTASIFDRFETLLDLFFHIKDDILHALSYFSDQLVFRKLFITLQIGFDDAAYTALATGLCYTMLSPILGLVFNQFRVMETNTDVKACYHEKILSANVDIELSLRPYSLIVLLIKGIKIVTKIQKFYKNIKRSDRK